MPLPRLRLTPALPAAPFVLPFVPPFALPALPALSVLSFALPLAPQSRATRHRATLLPLLLLGLVACSPQGA